MLKLRRIETIILSTSKEKNNLFYSTISFALIKIDSSKKLGTYYSQQNHFPSLAKSFK